MQHQLDSLYAEAVVGKDHEAFSCFSALMAAYRAGTLFLDHKEPVAVESDLYVQKDSHLYTRRAFNTLESIDREFTRLKNASLTRLIDEEKAKKILSDCDSLLEAQKKAITHILSSPVGFIWGGPGTGKTYTAGFCLTVIANALVDNGPYRVALTAPTAKATQNLYKSMQKMVPENVRLEKKTLHSLLEFFDYTKSKKAYLEPLMYDLILVDESSMIDAKLFDALLKKTSSGSRLIFLGDPDQLPPVDPGAPFSFLIDDLLSENGKLSECKRIDLKSIITFSTLVRDGLVDETLSFIQENHPGVSVHFLDDDEKMMQALEGEVKSVSIAGNTPEALFSSFSKKQILTPIRHSAFGLEAINQQIFSRKKEYAYPIIISKNDYQLDLANGEIGMVVGKTVFFETVDGFKEIPKVLLGMHDLAYAITVHKSQGSEYDEVVLFLPEGSERFGKSLLYTAITRAKKKITIYTKKEIFEMCILDKVT